MSDIKHGYQTMQQSCVRELDISSDFQLDINLTQRLKCLGDLYLTLGTWTQQPLKSMYEIIDQLNSSKQRKNSSSQCLNTEHRTDQCKLIGKQFVSDWYQLEQIKGTHLSKLGLAGYFSKIRGKISSRLNGMQFTSARY
jgi:hypothetical protein